MGIADRIEGTIENWRVKWGKALQDFLVNFLSFGLDTFMKILGRSFAPKLKPVIDMLEASGEVPPELQKILDEIKEPTGEVASMFAQSAGGALVGGALGAIMDSLFNPIAYWAHDQKRNVNLSETQYIALWLRGQLSDADLASYLHMAGLSDTQINILKTLTSVRLDPGTVAKLWLRDKPQWEALWKDLEDSGVSKDRIVALKEAAYVVPSPAELITMMAHEAFEEDAVTKYGLDAEFGSVRLDWMEKAGIKPEVAKLFWRSHWSHASFTQIIEMLHRGLVTEDDVRAWFRLVEVPPYWRDLLIKIAYTWPTRVDVRRWWDMRTISEERLRELYEGMGYQGDNLEDYIKWTKVYTDFPMMLARFTKGWITEDEVYNWLITQGIPEERARHFIEEKIKPEAPERVSEELALTKAEIIKGVKKEVISWTEGYELLQDIGKSEREAKFILEINVGALEGSPDSYQEFKKITQLYRQSQGLSAHIPPEEVIQAEKDVKEAEIALQSLRERSVTGAQLTKAERAFEDAKILYHQLLQSQ